MNIIINRNSIYQNRIIQLTTLAGVLLVYRIYISGSTEFLFMFWNLFLAAIPLFISRRLVANVRLGQSKILRYSLFFIWLIFLPNSPYIITDLIHLDNSAATIWLDMLILFIFALSGLLLGVLSMMDVFNYLRKHNHPLLANMMLLGISLLSGFGIFLGRFLRFNSWDIVARPQLLMQCIFKSLLLWNAWLWIIGFGAFIWVSFWVLKPYLREER